MPQNTNLNVSPYFDDFDASRNYQKVLFNPGLPVQARELTTLQTILQNQIEKFGNHFFKDGSVVIPGQIAYDPNYTCVQINSTHLGIPVSAYVQNLIGKTVKGQTSGVTAIVENYITNSESENSNYTLYIKYISSSDTNFIVSKFADGEALITIDNILFSNSSIRANSTFATTLSNNSTAIGSAAKIESGIFFIRGYFIETKKETVILDQYSNTPSYRIGFVISEEIITASDEYPDLYDNAQGFSNYVAPGADRFIITTSLIKKDIDNFNDENFIELIRVRNGNIEKFVDDTNYNLIRDELARRTYDESGDYYVRPFNISLKECVNDRIGNNGIFYAGEQTREGNIASDDLGCISISSGKAYVRGYEIDAQSTLLDFQKPRTTDKSVDENLQINSGNILVVNNVYGTIPVGFLTTSQILLYDSRTANVGVSSGQLIGISKVYDYESAGVRHSGSQTQYEISLYDTQLFTRIELNTNFTSLTTPKLIEGYSSGARGFLYQSVSNSNQLFLYDVSGSFNLNEPIKVDGVSSNKIIATIKDYQLGDVHQVVANSSNVSIGTFTADPVLSKSSYISNISQNFTVSAASSGISTVSASTLFFNIINVGDVISYTKQGEVLPTYNRVSNISQSQNIFSIIPTQSISGVSSGSLPTSLITTTDIKKVEPIVINPKSNLYLNLKYNNSVGVDLSRTSFNIKKTFSGTNVSSSSITYVLSEANLAFESFDEENYTLSYVNGGNIVPLVEFDNINFSSDRKSLTISKLTQTGLVTLIATCKLNRASSRRKTFNRCSSSIITNSNLVSSGLGATTLNDGLTYSGAYGLRVQDREISLNVPEAIKVLGIYQSSSTADPEIPSLVLSTPSSSILNVIKGEKIIGSNSNSVGYFVGYLNSTKIEYVGANENAFIVGELVQFEESGISAVISESNLGDNNITNLYALDSGYREQYLDFSRIIRNDNSNIPSRKIRIIYNNYTTPSNSSGDIVSISSYDFARYAKDLPKTGNLYASDILDFRPIVSAYSGTFSPFEAKSRIFTEVSSSSPYIFSKNSTISLSYDYYLPRIDKLFLYKTGNFVLSTGIPTLPPTNPQNFDNALEIATFTIPAYLRDINTISVSYNQHKRYTMQDISKLDARVKNIEYYTLLSLLEQDTKNLVIRDTDTGLDRFKSGFFVDNFRSLDSGDTQNPDYKVSVDTANGILRPSHYTTALDLIPGVGIGESTSTVDLRYAVDLGSNSVKKVGDIVCLNYDEVEYIKNPFATRIENVNPFAVINWVGTIEFNPSSDSWVETRRLDDQIVGTVDGNYTSTLVSLGVDTNTGLSPVQWGSWETTWAGTSVNVTESSNFAADRPSGTNLETVTTTTTTTTQAQVKSGTQFQVTEQYDTVSLGDKTVSTANVTTMRSRNIEIIATRLKPTTRFYAFFDDVNMTEYMIPKLIEVNMNAGTFIVGETVTGILGSKQIRFRLVKQNHKYGPVDSSSENIEPNLLVEEYSKNIYNPNDSLPNIYSPTSTTLNIDTASLELTGASEFYGCISIGMRLVGTVSGAVATVSDLRLISDSNGTFIGSLFIPDPTIPSTPVFQTGTRTFTITTSEINSVVGGVSQSSGIGEFTATGVLESVEANNLMIRNADVETVEVTARRLVTDTSSTQTVRYTDPLAQSFVVDETNGIFLTKCDIYFQGKDLGGIPVTLQIRTVELGIPTQVIIPFGTVTLNPDKVNISENGSVPTTFYFPSPVYLDGSREYAIVLLSASTSYTVWISRMGETEISTTTLPESDRVIISQQPLLGSLFKSQNGSTWDPSQYEDLKFTTYRADFTATSGSIKLYNPDLNIGNNQVVSLRNNPILAYSRTILASIGKSFTNSDINALIPGATVTQQSNSYFNSDLVSVVGAIGIGSTLIVSTPQVSFGNTTTTYNNVNLTSFTGLGRGAAANIGIVAGIARTVTVISGGSGYIQGDVLSIDTNSTNNLGRDLLITIPTNIGVISAFNSILLTNVQGQLNVDTPTNIVVNGGAISSSRVSATPIEIADGLHIKVQHNNHGMYAYNNFISLTGVEPDTTPLKLTSNVIPNTTTLNINSVGILTTFENLPISVDNPGYVLINSEIIKYTSVDTVGSSIGGIQRFTSNFINSEDPILLQSYFSQNHSTGDYVLKYEFNGISLLRINRTHNLSTVNKIAYPTTLDSYHIKIDTASNGADRSLVDILFFNQTKFGGSYFSNEIQSNTVRGPKATQNILMSSIRPNIQTLLPESTNISAKIRTISGSSISGTEASFVDMGFEPIALSSNNFFSTPRIICSKINETNYLSLLPNKKSFTMELTLSTNDRRVSPVIDLDRINIIATNNRIDRPVLNYINDSRVNELYQDPHAAVYVSKLVTLEQPADSLSVIFDAYRHSTNDIRVAYRLIRDNMPPEQQVYELFPGYANLDNNKNTLDLSKNDGSSDRIIQSSNTLSEYKNYEFTAKSLPQFTGYQIKIMMNGTSQSNVPLIRDLRAIATL